LELREEIEAAAPGSPWGGGEGLTNNPWSALLTRRMLAQGKEWSNAMEKEFGYGKRALGLGKVSPMPGKKYQD